MNRTGQGNQSLRGLPSGFSTTQGLPQSRSVSARLPNGKPSTNGPTWSAFGAGAMGSVGLPTQRSNNGPATSFAATIGGSQSSAPIDLSEFPSLSTNPQQQGTASASSMWANSTGRSAMQTQSQRIPQSGMMSSLQQTQAQQQTQQQQDDLFSTSSQLPSTQGAFRFGGQSAVGQPQGNPSDEFPPLSRNTNGEIGQDRASGLMQSFNSTQNNSGFGSGLGGNLGGGSNGLLNALSSSSRAAANQTGATSPRSVGGPSATKSPVENSRSSFTEQEDAFGRSPTQNLDAQLGRPGQLGAFQPSLQAGIRLPTRPEQPESTVPEVEDPLAGFSDKDRFGLKGLTAMLSSCPEQAALMAGVDVSSFGFDVGPNQRVSEMIWSPFDDTPPRPRIPNHTLPDCYQVHNVRELSTKLDSFADETIFAMFYDNPRDIQQMEAAHELTHRNWRYHKKLQKWLTKDDLMVPQPVGEGIERGYYIFFEPTTWTKERRELLLAYADLEQVPQNDRLLRMLP